MNYSKEIIKKIYRNLPVELSQIVATQETSVINDEIAKKFSLTKEQRQEMGDEITTRLIGITPDEQFTINIETRLKVTREIAQKIVDEIGNRILSKISKQILSKQGKVAQEMLKSETTPKSVSLEIHPNNLPVIEPGEVAHDVPHVEEDTPVVGSRQQVVGEESKKEPTQAMPPAQKTPLTPHYPGGLDPYREPLV
ncbi:MAG: hypothetical protein NUV78_00510 [Candidatus Zambryskibacteria bacterium]|nr:hypothetical protein [Candidatus Zambryskibacteria bacterium]